MQWNFSSGILTRGRLPPRRHSAGSWHSLPEPPAVNNTYKHVTLGCIKPETEWRRCTGYRKLQISFRKRATNYRALLRKMTYKDKASYGPSPICTSNSARGNARARSHTHSGARRRRRLELEILIFQYHLKNNSHHVGKNRFWSLQRVMFNVASAFSTRHSNFSSCRFWGWCLWIHTYIPFITKYLCRHVHRGRTFQTHDFTSVFFSIDII